MVNYATPAIISTIVSLLGLLGMIVIIGLDLFQDYEASGMLSTYIGCSVIFLTGLVASGVMWGLHLRDILARIRNYETI
jgi:hypothetical protein